MVPYVGRMRDFPSADKFAWTITGTLPYILHAAVRTQHRKSADEQQLNLYV
jgi:hypothetical protein